MNKLVIAISFLVFFTFVVCTGCNKEESTRSPYIEGLTIDSYSVVDGSTSTLPLNCVIACELMGMKYQWQENMGDNGTSSWSIEPLINGSLKRKFDNLILSSQTHQSLLNLIDKKADIVLSARAMSPDEKAYARLRGITIIETPIALDALIFIIHPQNEVTELSTAEIQDIYTGKISQWTDLGWKALPEILEVRPDLMAIHPYIRNPNSGSQELMDLLVMKDLEYINLPMYEENLIPTMGGMIDKIASDKNAIGYTVFYYNYYIVRAGSRLKPIAVDGVSPIRLNIDKHSYPFAADVYAVIRADTDPSSMAFRIYEWLQSEAGRQVISKSGYLLN